MPDLFVEIAMTLEVPIEKDKQAIDRETKTLRLQNMYVTRFLHSIVKNNNNKLVPRYWSKTGRYALPGPTFVCHLTDRDIGTAGKINRTIPLHKSKRRVLRGWYLSCQTMRETTMAIAIQRSS